MRSHDRTGVAGTMAERPEMIDTDPGPGALARDVVSHAPAAPRSPSAVGLVLARSDSSRLPRKALIPVEGRPLIGYVFERASRITGLSHLALATTDRGIDDELADYAGTCGIDVCRGDTQDVTKRLLDCSSPFGADYLIRINADSPFLDPALIAEGLSHIGKDRDLITNIVGRTFPYGVSVEIIRREALELTHARMTLAEREHVTEYIYVNDCAFSIFAMTSDSPELSAARMVVDTEEDLLRFKKVVHALGDDALTADYRQAAACYLSLDSNRP
jgi:spore coat polysaccharide biosynthesis protein SpsF